MARIKHDEFGRIVVDGRQETRDLIILPDRVVRNWWRQDGHAFFRDDLAEVLNKLPSHLVVGTGADERMQPHPNAIPQPQRRGITVEALRSGRPPPHLLTHRAETGDSVREIHTGSVTAADWPAARRPSGPAAHRGIPLAREVR